MKTPSIPKEFCERLKWAIYEWIGTVSVKELARNRKLSAAIEQMCRRLQACTA